MTRPCQTTKVLMVCMHRCCIGKILGLLLICIVQCVSLSGCTRAGVNIPIQDTQPGGGRKCVQVQMHSAVNTQLCIRLGLQYVTVATQHCSAPISGLQHAYRTCWTLGADFWEPFRRSILGNELNYFRQVCAPPLPACQVLPCLVSVFVSPPPTAAPASLACPAGCLAAPPVKPMKVPGQCNGAAAPP